MSCKTGYCKKTELYKLIWSKDYLFYIGTKNMSYLKQTGAT
jgi:hypothetical protein